MNIVVDILALVTGVAGIAGIAFLLVAFFMWLRALMSDRDLRRLITKEAPVAQRAGLAKLEDTSRKAGLVAYVWGLSFCLVAMTLLPLTMVLVIWQGYELTNLSYAMYIVSAFAMLTCMALGAFIIFRSYSKKHSRV
jgi:hypothetical protein